MARFDLYLKVEVDSEAGDEPERVAAEICRQIRKIYGVRGAELSSWVDQAGAPDRT